VRDAFLTEQAPETGTYTVVVSAAVSGQSGTYGLHLAQAPEMFDVSSENQGGRLQNGSTNSGNLNMGDLKLWSFIGTAGDSNVLRVTSTNFAPWIRLYGPTGTLVAEIHSAAATNQSAALPCVVTNAGPHTVVLSAAFTDQSGTYTLTHSHTLVHPTRSAHA
jgi:hypothetical protein